MQLRRVLELDTAILLTLVLLCAGSITAESEDIRTNETVAAFVEEVLVRGITPDLRHSHGTSSDRWIYNLASESYSSTTKKLAKVSGRRVGMDVVKRRTLDPRGNIDIHSELIVGTAFSIRLPVTLAIIDGKLLPVDGRSQSQQYERSGETG